MRTIWRARPSRPGGAAFFFAAVFIFAGARRATFFARAGFLLERFFALAMGSSSWRGCDGASLHCDRERPHARILDDRPRRPSAHRIPEPPRCVERPPPAGEPRAGTGVRRVRRRPGALGGGPDRGGGRG